MDAQERERAEVTKTVAETAKLDAEAQGLRFSAWTELSMKLAGAVSFLIVSVALVVAVLIYQYGVTIKSPYGDIVFGYGAKSVPEGGTVGIVRANTQNTVWTSECPAKSAPISGTCIVLDDGSGKKAAPLQNVGPIGNEWGCTWTEPVIKAFVQAVCLKTQ